MCASGSRCRVPWAAAATAVPARVVAVLCSSGSVGSGNQTNMCQRPCSCSQHACIVWIRVCGLCVLPLFVLAPAACFSYFARGLRCTAVRREAPLPRHARRRRTCCWVYRLACMPFVLHMLVVPNAQGRRVRMHRVMVRGRCTTHLTHHRNRPHYDGRVGATSTPRGVCRRVHRPAGATTCCFTTMMVMMMMMITRRQNAE